MGAVAAELQSIGHRPNFFYLQHAMGLASSMGLGIALARPELRVVVLDGDGSVAGARARAGDGFAVPAACNDLDVEGELRVLRCLAPEP
jgi:hypothetical protein